MFLRNFVSRKCELNTGMAVKHEQWLCSELGAVRVFAYLGDMVSVGGVCEAAITARTRYGWVMFREWGELLYGMRFFQKLRGAVCKNYVDPALLHGRELWCLEENKLGIL